MKRDMYLARAILLWAEAQPGGTASGNPDLAGHSAAEIAYHVHLLWQAGLVSAFDIASNSLPGPAARLTSLTWDGHDFLDAARNDGVWNQALRSILDSGKSFTFDLLKEALHQAARGALGL